MSKIVTALIATAFAGFGLAAASTGAAAKHWYPGCNCGPKPTSTYYKTVHPAKFTTRFHDVHVTRRVQRIHRVVNVTRIQPIIHIHDVTRVHHHTVVTTRNAYEHVTQRLTPIRYVRRSVQNFYDCGCGR